MNIQPHLIVRPSTPRPAVRLSPGPPIEPFLHDPAGFLHHLAHRVGEVAAMYGPILAAFIVVGAAVYAALRHVWWRRRHDRLARRARQIVVLAPPDVDPHSAHALWANLVGLLRPAVKRLLAGQPHLAFEYVWTAQTLQIRIWVPGIVPPGLVERAVEAAWPAAQAHTGPPQLPLPAGTVAVGGRLRLSRPDWLPLRADHPSDPLRALIGAASGLAPNQHAVVQILARPATGRRLAKANKAAAALRGGQSAPARGRLFDLITPTPARRSPRTSAYTQHPERAAEVRAILDKAQEPQWDTTIRYGLAINPAVDPALDADGEDNHGSGVPHGADGTPDPTHAPKERKVRRTLRRGLRGRAHAVASAYALYAGHNYLRRRRVRRPQVVLARRWLRRGDLLSVTELAALAHLPWDAAVPGMTRAGARSVPPPPVIAQPGPRSKPLGVSDAGHRRQIALGVADARHHVHVLGATGSGKSTLMAHMILADAAAGRGVVVIDPKGDLIVDLLSRLPEHSADKVVLFDPDERRARPTLNVLQGPDRNLAADNLVGIFRRIFADSWGPRTDDILRSACLTLWQHRDAALADVPRLLSDARYRAHLTAGVRDPILRDFWAWYDTLSPEARAHATGPVLNKVRAFLLRDFVRSTIASASSTVDLASVLDGGLLLVRAPKGMLGADASSVLGSLVVAKVWETVSSRARHGQTARHDAALYVDECQNFLTLPHGLEDLLAEARAYRLSVVLAHQNLAQLPRDLREAISSNARSKVYFAVSPEDAHHLERHVTPNLSEHDLAHLGGFQAGARLIVDQAEAPAFTLRTQPLPPPTPGRARLIRRISRDAHGNRTDRRGGRRLPDDDPRIRRSERT